jgi:hypothetical protein
MEIQFKKGGNAAFCGLVLFFLTVPVFGQNMFRRINDFDGDGRADFAVTRDEGGNRVWYIWQTSDGFRVLQWGSSTDQNAPGDYDGDGKTDPGIFRKEVISATSMRYSFWVYQSQSGVVAKIVYWDPNPDSFAYQQDYDGDGKTDFTFTIDKNTRYWVHYVGGFLPYSFPGGGTAVKLGDMLGDDKAEGASYNSSNVVSVRETKYSSPLEQTVSFGTAGDQYVAADFDGDGTGDLTVFRESDGTWWWMRSSDSVVEAQSFGMTGDVPVPADYDGDGKTDIAIWRPGAQSYFWVYGSQDGVFALPWGTSGDSVVTY